MFIARMLASENFRAAKTARPARIWGKALLVAAVVGVGLTPTPTHAATTDPVITAPAPGTVLPNRWDGSVTVDLSAAPSDDYWYSLECEGGPYFSGVAALHEHVAGDPSWSISADEYVVGPATCEATVRGGETGAYTSARWTVLGPSVTFDAVNVSQSEIFPIIRDGYADTVALAWWMTADATVTTEVRDDLGRAVKTASLGMLPGTGGQDHSWTWDGLRQDGTVVTPGDYTLTVTATGHDGISRSATKTVTAATGIRESGWKTSRRAGAQASKVTPKRGCLSIYQERGRSVTLDCARGRGSVAIWRFTLPVNAASITYSVRGRTVCCTQNPRITSRLRSATRYEVKVKVLRGQVARIDAVTIHYKVRTPI